MTCEECRGACCEAFRLTFDRSLWHPENWRWLALHASAEQGDELTFEVRCSALTAEGRCGIYENRPITCRAYEEGGKDCRAVVARRRGKACARRG